METVTIQHKTRLHSGRVLEAGEQVRAQRVRNSRGDVWYLCGRDVFPSRSVQSRRNPSGTVGRSLSENRRRQIYWLHWYGYSVKDICIMLGVSKPTAMRWCEWPEG